ncbi:MAG: hypothetical protein QW589_03110 [Candidatus Bathyarchaeia archaeon]
MILSETSILVYSCRISRPAEVYVNGYKSKELKYQLFQQGHINRYGCSKRDLSINHTCKKCTKMRFREP